MEKYPHTWSEPWWIRALANLTSEEFKGRFESHRSRGGSLEKKLLWGVGKKSVCLLDV